MDAVSDIVSYQLILKWVCLTFGVRRYSVRLDKRYYHAVICNIKYVRVTWQACCWSMALYKPDAIAVIDIITVSKH